jgi:uncharacterized protein (TIGR00251 family)
MKPEKPSSGELPKVPKGESQYIRVKVAPSSKHQKVKLMSDNLTYKVYIQAPPEKGKANKELIKFIAQSLNINSQKVKIISGEFSEIKLIKITND